MLANVAEEEGGGGGRGGEGAAATFSFNALVRKEEELPVVLSLTGCRLGPLTKCMLVSRGSSSSEVFFFLKEEHLPLMPRDN